MKPFSAVTIALAVATLVPAAAHAEAPHPAFPGPGAGSTTTVHLLGFNDFHGNLDATAVSPAKQYGVFAGGAANLARTIDDKRDAYGAANTVTVMAGDNIGASPLISAAFGDEPTIVALDQMGVDFSTVGNHEFDKGATELLRLADGCTDAADPAVCSQARTKIHEANVANGTNFAEDYVLPGGGTSPIFPGANWQYLSTNVRTTSSGQLAEDTLFPAYGTKSFPTTAGGTVTVGFIGLTLKDTPTIVSPEGVAGLTFDEEVAAANAAAAQLEALGVNTIVMLLHQGGFQQPAPTSVNGCAGDLSPAANSGNNQIAAIVGPGSGLDPRIGVVISGHTHTEYVCTFVDNGRSRLVTSASSFGRVLTDATLTISDDTGELKSATAVNSIVESSSNQATFTPLPGDPTTAGIVAQYRDAVAGQAGATVGRITAAFTNLSQSPYGEMTAGDLVADAQLAATAEHEDGGAQIAFMNPGGVRSPGLPFAVGGVVTYADAFTMQPFYNYLVTKTMSGGQIRSLLEQQYIGCGGQTTQRTLLPSAGLRYETDPTAATCAGKIGAIQLDGVDLVAAQDYRVTMNSFLYTGGDGFTVFAQAPRDGQYGVFDIDALVAFLQPSIVGSPVAPIALATAAPVSAGAANRIVSIGSLVVPPPDVPEAPVPILLGLGGAAVVLGGAAIRRRRAADVG